MPAQKGKDLLVKLANGSGAFVAVAGLRAPQIAFNAESVDVTHSESAGPSSRTSAASRARSRSRRWSTAATTRGR